MTNNLIVRGLLLSALLVPSVSFAAFTVPVNDGLVTDEAHILSTEEEQSIETDLLQYQQQTSNEIAVLIVGSLDGYPASDAAVDVGRAWKVGTEKNNGVLMLIDYSGHEIFIATGYGLEGALPDIVLHGIVNKDMVPIFRDGDYAKGIQTGIDSIKKHIGGEFTADRYSTVSGLDTKAWPYIFFFIFFFGQWILAILARTKSWWAGGFLGGVGGIILTALFAWWISIPILVGIGLLLDFLVSRNYKKRGPTAWWAGGNWGPGGGFGGGRGGGGGFGGFGGGSFGGGGAGGKW